MIEQYSTKIILRLGKVYQLRQIEKATVRWSICLSCCLNENKYPDTNIKIETWATSPGFNCAKYWMTFSASRVSSNRRFCRRAGTGLAFSLVPMLIKNSSPLAEGEISWCVFPCSEPCLILVKKDYYLPTKLRMSLKVSNKARHYSNEAPYSAPLYS